MFYLENMCCLCLKSSTSLSDLFSTNIDEVTNFEKVESSLTRLIDVLEDDNDLLVCERCSDIIDMIYRFNNICLRNIERFSSYKSILKQNKEKTRCNLIIKMNKDEEETVSETSSENDECLNSDSEESNDSSGYIALADLGDSASASKSDGESSNKLGWSEEGLLISDNEKLHEGDTSNNHVQLFVRNKKVHKYKKYICPVCNKTFGHKGNFERHLRIHTGKKPFICKICNKSFSEKSNLNAHIVIHSDAKPHICDVCKKIFRNKSHLKSHKLVHSGEKQFSCQQCNKSFARKPDLVRHKQIHTGDKPFACDLCEKVFAHTQNLTRHRRCHTGEKPYSCNICTKSFAEKGNLNRHTHIHMKY